MRWQPTTLEDRLLERYLAENPGLLFLEVAVGGRDPHHGPRRLDGLLVPGHPPAVKPPQAYSRTEVSSAVSGRAVHVLEAKRVLNRNVIGQVQVGVALLQRDFEPAEVVGVAVCGGGNEDLAWYCGEAGIQVAVYDGLAVERRKREPRAAAAGPLDIRQPPDAGRQRAFLNGWEAAVVGQLYNSVRRRKTHAGMGNLFGYIYGNRSAEFRLETWNRYAADFREQMKAEQGRE